MSPKPSGNTGASVKDKTNHNKSCRRNKLSAQPTPRNLQKYTATRLDSYLQGTTYASQDIRSEDHRIQHREYNAAAALWTRHCPLG